MPSDLFKKPSYQSQHDFAAIKAFQAGNNIIQQPFVFLQINNKTFLMQPQHTHLLIFDQKWVKNLIDTFANIIQSQENVYTRIET